MRKLSLVLVVILVIAAQAQSQVVDSVLYKQVDSTSLYMHINYPPGYDATKSYPAIVFYFGGGWNGGTIGHFEPHARYFAQRGLVCFRVDYRVKKKAGYHTFRIIERCKICHQIHPGACRGISH